MAEESQIHKEASNAMKLHELTSYIVSLQRNYINYQSQSLEISAFKADHGFNCQTFQNSCLSVPSPLKDFSGEDL